jgi:hypothetical protein
VYLVVPEVAADMHRVNCWGVALAHPGAVIAGASAARLWGLETPGGGPVEVVVPRRATLRARPDLRPHQWSLQPGDVVRCSGLPVTTPARTVLDVVRSLARPDGLALLDQVLRKQVLRPHDLVLLRGRARGQPNSVLVEDLWDMADGRAATQLESRVRLRAVEGGYPPDVLQAELRATDGHLVARVDMLYLRRSQPGRGPLAVEADGAVVHSTPAAVHGDRRRGNGITAERVDLLRFTWRDTPRPEDVPDAIGAAL